MQVNGSSRIKINRLVGAIDTMLQLQLDQLLHHPAVQQLEGAWRSIYWLINPSIAPTNNIKIKILSITMREIFEDLTQNNEFDQSQLFHKIYTNEFDRPGGEPYGLIIGDYYFNLADDSSPHADEITLLYKLAKIAAAAFSPFVTSIHPSFFGLTSFTELNPKLDIIRILEQAHYARWKDLRKMEESHFIGLVLSRILMRPIYRDDFYHETCVNTTDYLWSNPCYYFAKITLQTFIKTGWFNDINNNSNPTLIKLDKDYYQEYLQDYIKKPSTEINITESMQHALNEIGIISLCENRYTGQIVAYQIPSIKKSHIHDQVSNQLNHMLCAVRFAHALKIMLRDKVGKYVSIEELEFTLNRWIHQYCANTSDSNSITKTKYPLRAASIKISQLANPTYTQYQCSLHLQTHYPCTHINAVLKVRTTK